MATLREEMGQETYDLLYAHYDESGGLIADMDDVLYCDDSKIPQDRIVKLEALLKPITDANSALVPIEAAKLLAAWGSEKAIEYFEYCINERIDRLDILDSHRLHVSYDTTYEKIIKSTLHYYARHADKSEKDGMMARARIFPLVKKIIILTEELHLDISYAVGNFLSDGWKEYLPVLKKCYLDLAQRPEDDTNRKWNLSSIIRLLQIWEPDFLKK